MKNTSDVALADFLFPTALGICESGRGSVVSSYGYRVSTRYDTGGRVLGAGARVAGRAGYKRKMAPGEAMVKAKGCHCQAARAVELSYKEGGNGKRGEGLAR